MKQWFDKVKNWIQDNPALAAVVAGVLAFGGYMIFKPSSTTSPAMYSAAVEPSVSAGAGGGTSGGGSSGSDGTLPAVAGFFSAFYDQMKGLISANQDSLAGMQESNQTALETLASKVNSLTAFTSPQVTTPPAIMRQMPDQTEYYQAPTSSVIGGQGGGMIIANNPTLDNWYGGGSQTSGSGSADFSGWSPLGSRSGASVASIVSSLQGMSQSQKESALQSAGLANYNTGGGNTSSGGNDSGGGGGYDPP